MTRQTDPHGRRGLHGGAGGDWAGGSRGGWPGGWPDDPLGRPSRLPDPELQPEFYAYMPWKRLVAWIVDLVPTVLLTLGILTVFLLPVAGLLGTLLLPAVYVVASLAYRSVMLGRFGATAGMWLAAIELRRRDDTPPSPLLAFLHSLAYSLAVAFVVPQVLNAAVMLLSRDGRGLFDYLLGTAMINRAGRHR